MYKRELINLITELKNYGVEVMMPDTEVKWYEGGVRCGNPTNFFDDLQSEMYLPKCMLDGTASIFISAKGDSMVNAGIDDGDKLQVELNPCVNDGDIIVAMVNGDMTVKTFFKDEYDRCWLLPQNDNYVPILIEEDDDVRFYGKVVKVMKDTLRSSYSQCKKILRESKIGERVQEELSVTKIKKAIVAVGDEIKVGRQWYSVFRVLVDRGFYNSVDSAKQFVDDINDWFPQNDIRLNADDLSRMAVQSFRKPVSMWDANNAPVQGKRFHDYLRIAREFNKKL